MKSYLLFALTTFFVLNAEARVKTLFHPYDPTLNEIANYILVAEESIDMALYNIDTTKKNPVIQALSDQKVQDKIQNQSLKVRILFEGYGSEEDNHKKMGALEKLGVDARYLGMGRKMHHKFAVLDSRETHPVLITGSANWSLSSRKNYNENILYFEDKPGVTGVFQNHFDLLWSKSKNFGEDHKKTNEPLIEARLEEGLSVFFNTENLKLTKTGFRKDSTKEGYVLTRQIVNLIDSSQEKIEIATTRIKLRPIYEALKRAAARGVQVRLLVTMGEYSPSYFRTKAKIKDCENFYEDKCSSSQNFAVFLEEEDYAGKENVQVRIKYFDFRKDAYLQKQMHSKYIISDDMNLVTGSFNWSVSAEYGHFENLIHIEGEDFPGVLSDYNFDFDRIWSMNRDQMESFQEDLDQKLQAEASLDCGFEPMALTFGEIDQILSSGRRLRTISPLKLCQRP